MPARKSSLATVRVREDVTLLCVRGIYRVCFTFVTTDRTMEVQEYHWEEIARHNSETSCWIVIANKVYDVTSFMKSHPGGGQVIMHYAGADATSEFTNLHRPTVLKSLGPVLCIGTVATTTTATYTMEEVARHNTDASTWIIINGHVYDVTKFKTMHPGGAKVVMHYAGADASAEFKMLHRADVLHKWAPRLRIGAVASSSATTGALRRHAVRASIVPRPSASSNAGQSYSMEEVARHNSDVSTWVVVNGDVYDVTAFKEMHPGGSKVVMHYAGADASDEFNMLHRPDVLDKWGSKLKIGAVSTASSNAGQSYSMEEVARHNTDASTWVVVNGDVYDVTAFKEMHPGGSKVVMYYAGADASDEFNMLHRPDVLDKWGAGLRIGSVNASTTKKATMSAKRSHSLSRHLTSAASTERLISAAELSQHASETDCWSAIHGKVYNLTPFLNEHPGGGGVLVKYAGRDATAAFIAAGHPMDIADQLGLGHLVVGRADASVAATTPADADVGAAPKQTTAKPPIDTMLSLFDIEAVARKTLTGQAWDYYSSGSDDEVTLRENHAAFQRIWFRPRTLVNVKHIDLSTTIMGHASSMPVYITACALGRLAHPEGEVVLTRAAHAQDVIQMCPTLASCTLEEMTAAAQPGQTQFFQLYVNHDRHVTEQLIARAKRGGVKAVCVTVDAPLLGRREKDMRNKFTLAGTDVQKVDDEQGKVDRSQGTARTISAFIDPSLNWDDIPWLKQQCHPMKLLLKGVQTGEDALMAVEHGLDGIICSNHGGRQMDFARSGIEVLAEVMGALRSRGWERRLEVLIDGGIRRGSDVIKALALGATGVGIGRPALYGMASYGQDGVEKVLQILRDEMTMNMRLIGAPTIKHITQDMIITKNLDSHITAVPKDELNDYVYEPLRTTSKL